MLVLKTLQQLLESYDSLITWLVAVSGWVVAYFGRKKDSTQKLTLSCHGKELFLENHGPRSVEALQAAMTLRDPGARRELAKNKTFLIGVSQVLPVQDRVRLVTIDDELATSVAEIAARQKRTLEVFNSSTPFWEVHLELNVTYAEIGGANPKTERFIRWLGTNPSGQWWLSFPPYYDRDTAVWHRRLFTRTRGLWQVLKAPRNWLRLRKFQREMGEHLEVVGTLQAIADNTLTMEQGSSRLQKVASKLRIEPAELVQKHLKLADEYRGFSLEAPESPISPRQPADN